MLKDQLVQLCASMQGLWKGNHERSEDRDFIATQRTDGNCNESLGEIYTFCNHQLGLSKQESNMLIARSTGLKYSVECTEDLTSSDQIAQDMFYVSSLFYSCQLAHLDLVWC